MTGVALTQRAAGYLMIGRRVRQKVELVAYIYVMYSVAAVLLVGAVYVSGGWPPTESVGTRAAITRRQRTGVRTGATERLS